MHFLTTNTWKTKYVRLEQNIINYHGLKNLVREDPVPGSYWIRTAVAAVTDPEICDEICSAAAADSTYTETGDFSLFKIVHFLFILISNSKDLRSLKKFPYKEVCIVSHQMDIDTEIQCRHC